MNHKAIKTELCQEHSYITEHCENKEHTDRKTAYWVTGEYGYIHTTLGSKRFWHSRSGANKFIRNNLV